MESNQLLHKKLPNGDASRPTVVGIGPAPQPLGPVGQSVAITRLLQEQLTNTTLNKLSDNLG